MSELGSMNPSWSCQIHVQVNVVRLSSGCKQPVRSLLLLHRDERWENTIPFLGLSGLIEGSAFPFSASRFTFVTFLGCFCGSAGPLPAPRSEMFGAAAALGCVCYTALTSCKAVGACGFNRLAPLIPVGVGGGCGLAWSPVE